MKNRAVMLRWVSAVLLFGFLFPLLPLFSVSAEQQEAVIVSNAAEWNALAEECVEEGRSEGMLVRLAADIDFSGEVFRPIPLFSGAQRAAGYSRRLPPR